MKIDINKKYRTRDGREVKLFTTESRIPNIPVTGEARAQAAQWQSFGWREDGRAFTGRGNPYPQLDLIEVREPREWWLNPNPCTCDGFYVETSPGEGRIHVREVID
jgi:hypothetical protein